MTGVSEDFGELARLAHERAEEVARLNTRVAELEAQLSLYERIMNLGDQLLAQLGHVVRVADQVRVVFLRAPQDETFSIVVEYPGGEDVANAPTLAGAIRAADRLLTQSNPA